MKTIKVTIEEFLSNGGILEVGREIYNSSDKGTVTGYYKEFNKEAMVHLASNASWTSFPILSHIFYIEIEVTPIYK